MPYTLKPNKIFAKDPNGDGYLPQNVVSDTTTAEQVAAVNAAGTAQVGAVQAKGAETLASIPPDYTMLSGSVGDLDNKVSGHIVTIEPSFNSGGQERYDFRALSGQTIRVTITEWDGSDKYIAIAFNTAGSTSDRQATFLTTPETFTIIAEDDYTRIVVWSRYAAALTITAETIGVSSVLDTISGQVDTVSGQVDTISSQVSTIGGQVDDLENKAGTTLVIDEAFAAQAIKFYPFTVSAGTPIRIVFSNRADSDKYMAVSFRTSTSGTDYQQIFPDCPGTYDLIADDDYSRFVVWTRSASDRIQITVTDSTRDMAYIAQKTHIKHIESIVSPVVTSTTFSSSRMIRLPMTIYKGQTVNVLISNYQSSNNKQTITALGYLDWPDSYYQQITTTSPGLYRITATSNYNCIHSWVADATTTSIRITAWVDGSINKPRTFSILGDSYSTFEGYNPQDYDTWYPTAAIAAGNDCQSVENCWWFKFARDYGCALQLNESWSGTPICNDGYGSGDTDASTRSFIARMVNLPQSELIFVLGGLNDYWAGAQLGDYVYSGWTDAQKSQFRPAMAYMLDWLQHHHVGAKIIFIEPNRISSDFKTSIDTVCEHYGVPVVALTDAVSVVDGHPDTHGMAEVYSQVLDTIVRG